MSIFQIKSAQVRPAGRGGGGRGRWREGKTAYRRKVSKRKAMAPSKGPLKVVWHPQDGPKRLFKYGEERSVVCYCTQQEKINFEGST